MAESTLAPKGKVPSPRGRPVSIGATKKGSPSTSSETPLRPMADIPMNKAALGKMSMAQLKRLLEAAQSPAERNVIQEAIQDKITPDTKMSQGGLTQPTKKQAGLKKLPTAVRNKMGYMKSGGLASSGNNDMRKGGMFK